MRTTIEAKHQTQLENLVCENEKIEYLLDVSHLLENYGEENNTTEVKSEHYFNEFIEVVSRTNDGYLYDEYVNIVDKNPLKDIEQLDSYMCLKCNVPKQSLETDAYMICPQCGESNIYFDSGTQGMSYEQEINSEVNTSFAYKRINHFNEYCISKRVLLLLLVFVF